MMYDFFIEPFNHYAFLRRALVACIALSLGCAPVGVLLVLRRMSLMGDALSHSVLPGVALGYLLMGLSLPAMGIGGMLSGLLVALLASFISRQTVLKEDASFVGFYLIALALGAILVSTKGKNIDLMHILFGSILAVDKASLILIASITSVSVLVMALIFRPLVLECFDPIFMTSISGRGSLYHLIFMGLVVLNMVSAFQALGTLMALGMMMLPAITARFWAREVWSLYLIAILFAILSGFLGLIFSYHYSWPSGPAIILVAGVLYLITVIVGPYGSLRCRHT
ncbi:MAG: zinc ABC transporter permease [Caedibacter sp. 37-49]|nr:MAG: zinc ABC transporter permease [Caedibacter sp. 37-49]